jgi:chorismate mutase
LALLDRWKTDPMSAPASAPDLATQVRPVLDRIMTELFPAIAAVQRYRHDPGCANALNDAAAAATTSSAEVGAVLPAFSRTCALSP